MGDTTSVRMKRIVLMILIAGSGMVIGCSSNNTNGSTDSANVIVSDTATSGMGADTTSAKTDSLRDSLNR
ncbi:MAG TPA: hypothetical protein VLZ28_07185 [Daejeonella sp.]|nr:hypothetical protein [Daejeonella sp.]